jgi:hypothetical protein
LPQAAKELAAGLEKKNNTTLKEVFALDCTFIEAHTSHNLLQLNLKSNAIKDKGAIALASALTTNNTLTVLNLSVNTITSPGQCSPRCSR